MLFKFESGVGSAMQASLATADRAEVNCFQQKIAKSRWRFATKGKISADWKLGSNQHQSLRALCDLL
jgi:hypothetical protein